MKKILFVFLFLPAMVIPQNTSKDSLWMPFKNFIGSWEGNGDGEPGKGVYERSYNFILNKKFIEGKNKSTYQPTEKYPAGEVHENLDYISYDKIRKTFVLRQFHQEGFVNQYTIDSISSDGKIIVFITESIENFKAGWRAKESYTITNENEFTETFALAAPGKDFEVYSKTVFKRKK